MRKIQSLAIILAFVFVTVFGQLQIASAALPEFVDLASKSGPAVVNINTEKKSVAGHAEDFFGEMFRHLPPGFDQFLGPFGGQRKKGERNRRQQPKQKSLGSGFIISADGYIVTNNHVVAEADVINVTIDKGNGRSETIKAKLVGADEETDLALLKIDGKNNLPFLSFGNSDDLKVGEWLLAIGNPFGLDHSVTAGILSATGRNINSGPFDNFLQTDASINPGNSGGPLLNMSGQVIGINTAIIASGQGIGFAIPSNMAENIISQIKAGKKVSRGWIGVTIQNVDDNMAKALGLPDASGAMVNTVIEDEPADRAGIREGDVIIAIDGAAVADTSALLRMIAAKAPGSNATITVWRDGKKEDLSIQLGERASASSRGGAKQAQKGDAEGLIGIVVDKLNDNERKENKLKPGEGLLVVEVEPDGAGDEAGLRPDDIILKAQNKSVGKLSELSAIVKECIPRGAVMLQVLRNGQRMFIPVDLRRKGQ